MDQPLAISDFVTPILFFIIVLCIAAIAFQKARRMQSPWREMVILQIGGFVLFIALTILPVAERSGEMRQASEHMNAVIDGALKSITVDSVLLDKPDSLLTALKGYRGTLPEPSHTRRDLPHVFNLRVETSAGRLDLSLHRTTEEGLYWISDPAYQNGAKPLGFITTNALDAF